MGQKPGAVAAAFAATLTFAHPRGRKHRDHGTSSVPDSRDSPRKNAGGNLTGTGREGMMWIDLFVLLVYSTLSNERRMSSAAS